MCQLLGMSADRPMDICQSFGGLRDRGGRTDIHKDGWGIAFFEGRGVRLLHEPGASSLSPLAEFVSRNPICSPYVIAHIRRATQGRVSLENTHPFKRELWGRYWIFAHNGHVENFSPVFNGRFTPVGETDSEAAFCWIMQELHARFDLSMPQPEEIFAVIAELVCQIGGESSFNFLLSNGDALIAHASTRLSWVARESLQGRAAVIATQPLSSDESWTELQPGTLCLFQNGVLTAQATTVAGRSKPECEGLAQPA